MKLDKIYFTALAVCLFGACSNDDISGPEVTPGADMQEATITISVATGDKDTKSRAEGEVQTPEEKKIHNLTVLYIRNNEVQGYGYIDGLVKEDGTQVSDTTACVGLKADKVAGTNYKMLVIANAGQLQSNAGNADINKKAPSFNPSYYTGLIAQLADQCKDYGFVMTNTTIGVTDSVLVKPGFNYIGTVALNNRTGNQIDTKPVILHRVASRVELVKLSYEWKDEDLKTALATFRLDSIFLANVRADSYIFPAGERTHLENTEAGYLYGSEKPYLPGGDIAAGNTYYTFVGTHYDLALNKDKISEDMTENNGFYVMENSAKATAGAYPVILYLKGSIFDAAGNVLLPNRYYRIELKDGVLRNTIYRIEATITGKGSTDPGENLENAGLEVKIELLPWIVNTLPPITVDPNPDNQE